MSIEHESEVRTATLNLPVALTFFAGQGEEPVLIKVGTAYASATHHRRPPPACGPVAGRR
jgi:amidase